MNSVDVTKQRRLQALSGGRKAIAQQDQELAVGQLSSSIYRLAQKTFTEITRQDPVYSIADFKRLLANDPLSHACLALKGLRAMATFGEYEHEDKELQKWTRGCFEQLPYAVNNLVRDLAKDVMGFGFGVAEIVPSTKMPGHRGEWRLENINILDPEKTAFGGRCGRIDYVIYNDNGEKKYIPYRKCLHIVNGSTRDPFGHAECRTAMPYYKAKQTLFAEMIVAGKNNATGILFGTADANNRVELLGPDNRPLKGPDGKSLLVSETEAFARQVANLEQNGIIITSKNNTLTPLLIPSGDNFWNLALQLVSKQILLAFMTPALIWDEGSFSAFGNSGLSGNHKSTLDANVGAVVQQIQEEILEKICRFLITRNFGARSGYGKFTLQPYQDPNFLAIRASNLISAISSQILPSSDLDVQNALREAVGVPTVNEQQFQQQLQRSIDVQLQQQQAMASPQEASAMEGSGTGQEQQFNRRWRLDYF